MSTDKADQANSFTAQQRYFRDYIEHHPEWTLYAIYADEGITGTSTRKRAEFNRMIDDARLGRFRLIMTKEVSRFSRNILDTIAYTRELKQLGIGVIFLNDGISTLDPDAELRLSIMASIAQEESRKTSARVKWGQTRQMERGVVFGHSLLGYDVHDGQLSINRDGAELVRRIFHQYGIEKKGTTIIARELSAAGYRTYTGSRLWSSSHIVKILKNEKYVGDLVQKKTFTPDYLTHEKKSNHGEEERIVLPNHHEPIVDRALWDIVQTELKRRERRRGAENSSVCYPFSGKIRCGECGGSFISRCKYRQDGTSYRRWGCSTSASARKCDVGRMLRDDAAAEMVKLAMHAMQIDRASIVDCVTALAMDAIGAVPSSDSPEQLQTKIDRVEKKKEDALDAFFSGDITREELQSMRERYAESLTVLHQRLQGLRAQAACPRTELEASIRQTLTAVLNGDCTSDALNRTLVEQITVFRDRHIELKLTGLPMVWHFTD